MTDYINTLIPIKEQKENEKRTGKSKQFRWLGFHERISRVNVDVFHKIGRIEVAPSVQTAGKRQKEAELAQLYASFFTQELTAAHSRDKTIHFDAFYKDIKKYTHSLPLILHFKAKIIHAFLKHLQVPNSLAIRTILSLFPHLARDLRHEMFPHFGEILDVLIDLVDESSPEKLESTFSCIAYLFKFLIRSLVERLDDVYFGYYISLLSHKRPFIRGFAAESLSYVIRRVHPSKMRSTLARFMSYPVYQTTSKNVLSTSANGSANSAEDNDDDVIDQITADTKARGINAVVDDSRARKQMQVISAHTVSSIEWTPERIGYLVDGLGKTFFSMIKNVQSGLHSSAEANLRILFSLLSFRSRLVRCAKARAVEVSAELLAAHAGDAKAAQRAAEDALARTQLIEQQSFRVRVLVSMTDELNAYTHADKSGEFWASVAERIRVVLLKWRKCTGRISGTAAEMSDISDSSDSDNEMADEEIHGRRDIGDSSDDESEEKVEEEDVVDERRRGKAVTAGELSRELVFMMGVAQTFVTYRKGLRIHNVSEVADVVMDLIDADVIDPQSHVEYPLFVLHAIALFTQVWSVASNVVQGKDLRTATPALKSSAAEANRRLAFSLPEMLALREQPYVTAYLIGALRRFLPVSDFQFRVLPKIIANITHGLAATVAKPQSEDASDDLSAALALLSVVLAPLPSHDMHDSKQMQSLSPVATFAEIVRSVQWLTQTYVPDHYIPQQFYPAFVKHYTQFRANEAVMQAIYNGGSADVENCPFNYVKTVSLSQATVAQLLQQVAQALLIVAHNIQSTALTLQGLSQCWAALQTLIGVYPDCSRTVTVTVPAAKKSKKPVSKEVTLYSVLYTMHTILSTRFTAALRDPSLILDPALMQALGHVVALSEAAVLGLARATDGAYAEEDFPNQELELLLSVDVPERAALPASLATVADALSSKDKSKVSAESWTGDMLVGVLADVVVASLNYDAQGKECLPSQSPLVSQDLATLYALQTICMKRLTTILDEVVARMETFDLSAVHRLLDSSKFWDNNQDKLEGESIDTSRNRDMVREVDSDEDSDEYAEEKFFAIKRSKKLWREYRDSMDPIDAKDEDEMRDRPKIDKNMFLSDVERLQKERKAKEAAEREAAITKIMVPKGLTHTQRRQLITSTLQQLRAEREKARKQKSAEGDRLEEELRRQYANVMSRGPITLALLNIAKYVFARSGEPSSPNQFHSTVATVLMPFLTSAVQSVRALTVEALATFPVLHFLPAPAPREGEDASTLPTNLAKHQKGECNLLSDLYYIVNLPVTMGHHKAVLRRLDTLLAHIETRLLPPLYLSILAPFVFSLFTMHMSLYFEPARKILEAFSSHYPKIAWPWIYSRLSDSLMQSHIVTSVASNALQMGSFSPSIPSADLISHNRASLQLEVDTQLPGEGFCDDAEQWRRDMDASTARQAAALASTLRFQFRSYNYVELDCGAADVAQKELFETLTLPRCEGMVNTHAMQLADLFLIFLRSEFTLAVPLLDTPTKDIDYVKATKSATVTFNVNGFSDDAVHTSAALYNSLEPSQRSEDMLLQTRQEPDSTVTVSLAPSYYRIMIAKMQGFLRMFTTSFRKVHKLPFAHTILAPIAVRLLNFPDNQLQHLALSLLQRLKLDYLTPYVGQLERLLDEKQMRNALATLAVSMNRSVNDSREELIGAADKAEDEAKGIYGVAYAENVKAFSKKTKNMAVDNDEDDGIIQVEHRHRAHLAPILLSILTNNLYGTRGKRGKSYDSRRAAITSFFALMPPQELLPFIAFFMRPFLLVLLQATGNSIFVDYITAMEKEQLSLAQAPLGCIDEFVASIPVAGRQSTALPAAIAAFADNTYLHTVADKYSKALMQENAMNAVLMRLIVHDNMPVLQSSMKMVNSTMNEFLLNMDGAEGDYVSLSASLPILTNAAGVTIKHLFAQMVASRAVSPVLAMNINAPRSIAAHIPIAGSTPRYLFPEIQTTKQVSFLNLLIDLTHRLRTASSAFLPTFFTAVLHLLHRANIRVARINELKNERVQVRSVKSRVMVTMLTNDLQLVHKIDLDELAEEQKEDVESPIVAEKATEPVSTAEDVEITDAEVDMSEEDVMANEDDDARALAIMNRQSIVLREVRKLCLQFIADTVDLLHPMFGLDVSGAPAPGLALSTEKKKKDSKKGKAADANTYVTAADANTYVTAANTPETWALDTVPATLPLLCPVTDLTTTTLYNVNPRVMYRYLHLFLYSCREQILRMGSEGTYARGGLAEAIVSIARHRALQPILALPHNHHILPSLFSTLSSPQCHEKVASAVLEVVEHLLHTRDQLLREREDNVRDAVRAQIQQEKKDQRIAELKARGEYDSDAEELMVDSDVEDEESEELSTDSDSDGDREFDEVGDNVSDDEDAHQKRRFRMNRRSRAEKLEKERVERAITQQKAAARNKRLTPWGEDSSKSPALLDVLEGLLATHAPALLHHLNMRMQMLAGVSTSGDGALTLDHVKEAKKRLSHAALPKREFAIAEKLSVFVRDSETAQTLLSILYPYLPVGSPRPPYSLEATSSYTHNAVDDLEARAKLENHGDMMRARLLSIFGIMKTLVRSITDVNFLVSFQNALATQFLLVFAPDARHALVEVVTTVVKTCQELSQDMPSSLLPKEALLVLENLVAVDATASLDVEADFAKRAAAYSAVRAETQDKFLRALRQEQTSASEGEMVDLATVRALPSLAQTSQVHNIDVDSAIAVGTDAAVATSQGVKRYINQWNEFQALPIVYAALHDLYSNEFAVRENAIVAIIDLINANIGASATADLATPSSLIAIIHNHAIHALANVRFHVPRRYFMSIFGALGRRFPTTYPAYAALTDPNPDYDFFTNIMHIQPHRRTAVLRRVVNAIEAQVNQAKEQKQLAVVRDQSTPQFASVFTPAVNSMLFPTVIAFLTEVSGSVVKESMKAARNAKYGKNSGTGANAAGVDHALLEECIRACGVFSSLLAWRQYQFRLGQLLMHVTKRHEGERFFLRAACSFVDYFPFDMGVDASKLAASATNVAEQVQQKVLRARERGGYSKRESGGVDDIVGLNGEFEQNALFEKLTSAVTDKNNAALKAVKGVHADVIAALIQQQEQEEEILVGHVTSRMCDTIRRHMGMRILPRLFAFSTDVKMENDKTKNAQNETDVAQSRSVGAMRVGVVMAAIKLLQKMSVVDFHLHFPRLMRVVCAQLGRKELEFRVAARKALVQILNSVGPAFFFYIISELHQALTYGYQLHVLGNSLHLCLETFVKKNKIAPGSIDYCLPTLLPLLRDDLVGPISEEKLVDALRARHPEIKSITAPAAFELIGEIIQFNPSITGVTAVLAKELSIDRDGNAPSLVTTHKIAHCMQQLVRGLRLNPTVKQEELLLYVHTILRTCTGYDDDLKKLNSAADSSDSDASDSSDSEEDSDNEWFDEAAAAKAEKRKKKIVYRGVVHKNNDGASKIVGNSLVGGKVSGGAHVHGIKKTMDEALSIHPSLGGTTWRSTVKEDDQKVSFVNVQKAQQFDKDIILTINSTDEKSSNYNGGSSMLLYGIDLLMCVLDVRKYGNIRLLAKGEDPTLPSSVPVESCCAEDVLVSMLEPLPGLMNKAILLLDRGQKKAKREIGNACGGLDAEAVKQALNKFKARTAQVVAASLRVTAVLIRIPLAAWKYKNSKHAKSLVRFVIHTLSTTSIQHKGAVKNTGGGTMDSQLERFSRDSAIHTANVFLRHNCFRVIAHGLNYNERFSLTDSHVVVLLPIIQYDLHHVSAGSGAFVVLQALFSKQIMLPQMYDIATVCSELLVRSFEPKCRDQAATIFLQFLMNYPLTPKRQEQHLSFLLNNLSYEIPCGRQGVIRLLQHIIAKFPFAYIEKYAETIFFPVVLAFYNDKDAKCKDMLTTLITSLFRRLGGAAAINMQRVFHREQFKQHGEVLLQKRATLCNSVFIWLSSKQPAQVRMACMVIGVIARAMGTDFAPYCEKLMSVLGKILKGAITLMLQQAKEYAEVIAAAKRSLRGCEVADDDVEGFHEEPNSDSAQQRAFRLLTGGQEDAEEEMRIKQSTGKNDSVAVDEDMVAITDTADEDLMVEEVQPAVVDTMATEEDSAEGDGDDEDAVDAEEDAEEDDEEDDEEEDKESSQSSGDKIVQLDTKSASKTANNSSNISSQLKDVTDDVLIRVNEAAATAPWHLAYTALCCLDKVWAAVPATMVAIAQKQELWPKLVQLCLHPHNWVRQAVARLMYTHFHSCDIQRFGDTTYRSTHTLFSSADSLFETAKTIALQMNSQYLDEKFSQLLVHNLTFTTLAMYMARDDDFFKQYEARVATLLQKTMLEREKEDRAAVLVERELTAGFIHPAMHWVISNVSFLARQTTNVLMKSTVYKYFAELAEALPGEHLHSFLIALLNPLYRTIDTPTKVSKSYRIIGGKNNMFQKSIDDLKQLALLTCEKLKHKCGHEVFLKAYNVIYRRVADVRTDRKRKQKMLAVTNPELYRDMQHKKHLKDRKKKKEVKNFALNFRK